MTNDRYTDKKIEELLGKSLKAQICNPPQSAVDRAVLAAKDSFMIGEKKKKLSFAGFVIVQIQLMQKRWWMLQCVLLFLAGEWLRVSGDVSYIHRGFSIVGALFVIFIIPELWKNNKNGSVEIEESSLFSLRKVYAAKLIAFGLVDTLMLTVFCILTVQMNDIIFADLLKQLIFPVMIAAAICLTAFSHGGFFNEIAVIMVCLGANSIWMLVAVNETVYSQITPLIWAGLFGICIGLIVCCIYKTLYKNGKYREAWADEINFG